MAKWPASEAIVWCSKNRVLDSGRQERIFLKDPVPVHLDYRTAFTDARGRLQFRPDIYGRDGEIHAALVKAGVDG